MRGILKAKVIRVIRVPLALLLVAAIGLSACAGPEEVVKESDEYIHEILATGDVGTNEYSTDPPGQSTILPREYPDAPPLLPHSIEGLNINKDVNSCLSCHMEGFSFGEGHTATRIPESHYIDIATSTRSEDIQELRYNCLLCHLPQSPEEPLVDN